ncbi:hypothetical protein SAMN02910298_01690 [Pseudobutyrivibrio sp. YE44]|uniref:hypothetical protein n=1 Tax=Pseudobutyrivibrio sp. YE44 TaxID=1520802 RepID=UPI000892554D|nr:hypothetical protein [Pseudobutyrivibrio sp. YE44]SDB34658.1 hypothetical protein SAMN02910298_01690 [Pseudobutyrivibrio sp. YE44]
MRRTKKVFGYILAMFLMAVAIVFMALNADAAEAPYTYTVKIYIGGSGKEGAHFKPELGDRDCLTFTGLTPDDTISFNPQEAVEFDDGNTKYAVKGFWRSGDETKDENLNPTINGDKDETYVVAYGVGTVVDYTVQFLKEDGSKLMEDAVYQGIEGSAVVVSARGYKDGGFAPIETEKRIDALEKDQVIVFKYKALTGGSGGTITNTSTNTEYSTVTGASDYSYQIIPRQPTEIAGGGDEGGVVNNRAAQAGGNDGGGQAEAGGGAGATQIGDDQVPANGDTAITIPETKTPEGIDANTAKISYVRYLIIISILGMMIVLIAILGTYNLEHDKKRKN